MTFHGYQRVESDPTLCDNPRTELLNGNEDLGSNYNLGIDLEENSFDEIERQELEDHLCEIPDTFHRRQRREALFGSSVTRGGYSESYETNQLLHTCHDKIGHSDADHSEDSKGVEEEEEEEEEEHGTAKKYAKLILPHVALVLLTCAYTVLGASIFYTVEQPHEMKTKQHQLKLIYTQHDEFVDNLVRLASANRTGRSEWELIAQQHLHNMSDQLFVAFEKYFLTSIEVKKNTTAEIWSFSTAIFFAVTVVTTIGYGNPVPVTNVGRIVCIMFSLFGIPLTLVTIADLGKFLSEHLVWMYGNYLKMKHFLFIRRSGRKERREHVCEHCQRHGIGHNMHVIEEHRSTSILQGTPTTSLNALVMLPYIYFQVGFGDLMPRRNEYMYVILLYIILGLAITTMCIDLVGVQYIRKIHYFGRKIQDARSALAVVGGKVVLVSELYANLMQKRARNISKEAFIIENLYISKHIIPYIPSDIRLIRYIDQHADGSLSTSSSSLDLQSCRFCHSRFSFN
ncbi:hypothetical protein Angca_006441, partial [Angiostrongylus cantonensis]